MVVVGRGLGLDAVGEDVLLRGRSGAGLAGTRGPRLPGSLGLGGAQGALARLPVPAGAARGPGVLLGRQEVLVVDVLLRGTEHLLAPGPVAGLVVLVGPGPGPGGSRGGGGGGGGPGARALLAAGPDEAAQGRRSQLAGVIVHRAHLSGSRSSTARPERCPTRLITAVKD